MVVLLRKARSVGLVVSFWLAASAALAAAVPEGIVSLSPNVTEILHGLGVFERVVAVSTYCEFPEEVKDLPRVGGWTNTDFEGLVSLEPELVILTAAQAPIIGGRLDQLALRWFAVETQSLSDILDAIREIGNQVGVPSRGEELAGEVESEIGLLTTLTRDVDRPRVLVVVDRLPGTLRDMYIATKGSFLTDLVRAAGGDPVMPNALHHYAQLSTEALVALDPEVILDVVQALGQPVTLANATGGLRENPQEVWNDVSSVSAVREGRVYLVDDRRAVHPSQFVIQTGRRFLELLHPGIRHPEQ